MPTVGLIIGIISNVAIKDKAFITNTYKYENIVFYFEIIAKNLYLLQNMFDKIMLI